MAYRYFVGDVSFVRLVQQACTVRCVVSVWNGVYVQEAGIVGGGGLQEGISLFTGETKRSQNISRLSYLQTMMIKMMSLYVGFHE